jgi:hypothetical protein
MPERSSMLRYNQIELDLYPSDSLAAVKYVHIRVILHIPSEDLKLTSEINAIEA